MNSYIQWIHMILSYINSYASWIHIWIQVNQGSGCLAGNDKNVGARTNGYAAAAHGEGSATPLPWIAMCPQMKWLQRQISSTILSCWRGVHEVIALCQEVVTTENKNNAIWLAVELLVSQRDFSLKLTRFFPQTSRQYEVSTNFKG